jgi:DNA-binding response OmpR family regulator
MQTLLKPQLQKGTLDEKPRILIIDDDRDQVSILQYHLSQQGFEVLTAYTGSDGLNLLKNEMPDLVLLDIELPDATGLDLCEQICDDPETLQIPVIFVSGADSPNILRRARSAGCSFYMRKPYDPNALLVLIQQTLDDERY